jgi:hypothetical protein
VQAALPLVLLLLLLLLLGAQPRGPVVRRLVVLLLGVVVVLLAVVVVLLLLLGVGAGGLVQWRGEDRQEAGEEASCPPASCNQPQQQVVRVLEGRGSEQTRP